jgi:transcriptional regulator of met regulon
VCRLFYSLQHRHCYTGKYLPELENLKKEVKLEIARAKRSYKEKLEVQLGNNNSDSARDSMKTI